MDPHSPTCLPTIQLYQISCLTGLRTASYPILAHLPGILPRQESKDNPALNRGAYQYLQHRLVNMWGYEQAGQNKQLALENIGMSSTVPLCKPWDSAVPRKIQSMSSQENKFKVLEKWKTTLREEMRKEQHQKHMDLSFHFLKKRTNTLISACLPMQVQQTHLYLVDSYMKAANAKVYPRLFS